MIVPKKSTVKTGARKTASKTAIQETAEATDDLTGNKIADRVTSLSKKNLYKMIKLIMKWKYQKKDIYL